MVKMDRLKTNTVKGLRFLERYTRTDMVYLARGSFWLGIGQIVSSGAAFLASIAFANLLAPETFGIYKYILSINSLLLITTLAGMDSAVTQSVARGYEGTLALGVKTKMKWGVFGTIISLGIALYYFFQGNMVLAIAFSITAVFVPFSESFDMFNSLLWGKKLFEVQTKYNVIKKIIALAIVIGIIFLTQNIYFILIAYFLSTILPNIYFLHRTKKIHISNNNVDPDAIKYGKNLSAIYIIGLLVAELDKILVFHYIGPINLAIYSLAVAPTDQIKGLLKNVNSLAMPQLSNRTPEEIKKGVWRKVLTLTLFTTLIILFYILLAPLFFRLFFPKYLDSVLYSQFLSLSIISAVVAGFFYTILESQKAQKELYKYNAYSNSISILILFPLVYYYGIWGAVLSKIVGRLFMSIYLAYLIKKL
jgi:O-antigen/teichoic acid export membrane protein